MTQERSWVNKMFITPDGDSPRAPRGRIGPWTSLFLSLGVVVGALLTLVLAWLPIPDHDGFWCFRWLDDVDGDGWFNAARTAVTVLGALGIGGAAYIAFRRQAAKEVERYDALDRDQQAVERALHDRTTAAAEQLGHDNASIRMAGVYALAAIADDWLRIQRQDQAQAVVNVLTAYLRSDTLPPNAPESDPPDVIAKAQRVRQREEDVRAAIIGSISERRWPGGAWTRLALDLRGAYLINMDLFGAHLTGANLTGAHLTGAHLFGADLFGADLFGAHLFGADLTDTDLTRADLTDADLTDANLTDANLTDANLTDANLSGVRGAVRGQFTAEQLKSMKRPPPFADDEDDPNVDQNTGDETAPPEDDIEEQPEPDEPEDGA